MNQIFYYVYYLVDPRTGQPFYVGKGKRVPGRASRWRSHILEAKRWEPTCTWGNSQKLSTIKDILTTGIEPSVDIVFKTVNEAEAFEQEKYHITLHGRLKCNTGILTNLTPGGDGKSSLKNYASEERERRRQLMIGPSNPMYGKRRSAPTRKMISNTRKHRIQTGVIVPTKHTTQHKQKLAKEQKLGKLTSRQVCQMCPITGSVIKIFDSTRQAGKALNIKAWRNISQACKHHKHRIVGGYYWRWSEDDSISNGNLTNLDALNMKRKGTPIDQLTLEGELIKTWKDMKSVAEYLGVVASTVTYWTDTNKLYCGYLWKRTT